jgi:hypothetical protein
VRRVEKKADPRATDGTGVCTRITASEKFLAVY